MSRMHFGRVLPIAFRQFPSLTCHNLLGERVRVPEDLAGQYNVLVVGFKTAHYKSMTSWMPFANQLRKELLLEKSVEENFVQIYRLVIRHRWGVVFRWWTDERLRLAVGDGSFESDGAFRRQLQAEEALGVFGEGVEGLTSNANGLDSPPTRSSVLLEASPEARRTAKLKLVRSRTLVCFTKKSTFVDALQLADPQRAYIFLVSREGEIAWCDHESYAPEKEMEIREILHLPPRETLSLPKAPRGPELLPVE